MLCVATIGISRACRDSANVRSSPVGSVSPTVAKAWYSSQTNSRSRHDAFGLRRDLRDALEHGALEIQLQHDAQDRAPAQGSSPTGKFSARTLPALEQRVERRERLRLSRPAGRSVYALRGGQNARCTAGLSSNSDRNTTTPSTMDDRSRRVEPTPAVQVPALDALRAGASARPTRRPSASDDVRRPVAPSRNVSSSASYGCAMWSGILREPMRPRRCWAQCTR